MLCYNCVCVLSDLWSWAEVIICQMELTRFLLLNCSIFLCAAQCPLCGMAHADRRLVTTCNVFIILNNSFVLLDLSNMHNKSMIIETVKAKSIQRNYLYLLIKLMLASGWIIILCFHFHFRRWVDMRRWYVAITWSNLRTVSRWKNLDNIDTAACAQTTS